MHELYAIKIMHEHYAIKIMHELYAIKIDSGRILDLKNRGEVWALKLQLKIMRTTLFCAKHIMLMHFFGTMQYIKLL